MTFLASLPISLSASSLLIGCVTIFLASWLLTMKKTWRMPPGPFQWPILGNVPQLAAWGHEGQLDFLRILSKKYNGIFSLKFGDHNAVLSSDVKIVREAMVKQGECFSDRPKLYTWNNCVNAYPYHNAIITNDGDQWKYLRRFATVALRDVGVGKVTLEDKIHEEMVAMVTELKKVEGQRYDIANLTCKAITNLTASIIFGDRYDYNCDRFQALVDALRDIMAESSTLDLRDLFKIFRILPLSSKLLKVRAASRIIKDEIENRIMEHTATYNPNETRDVLDMCIKEIKTGDSKYIDHKTMVQIGLEFLLAGSETSATTLSWVWLYMAQYPDVQKRCQEEIDEKLGTRGFSKTDRQRLPYCEATLAEVGRISSIAPLSAAHKASKDTTLAGYDIPKGTWFIPMLFMVHSDPKYIKDADKFIPERYLDEDGKYVRSDSWMPFSVGPRACAGETLARMELFIMFTSILQKFNVRKASSQALDFQPILGFTCSPKEQELIVQMR